ncbi:MAG: hypothetical protein MI923_17905, partial [Phycisphaerales bacterium]|nr:hypothetical protein [Phycisphaerales bacterium]
SGQGWEIPVILPYRLFTHQDKRAIQTEFEKAYQTLFGRTIDGLPIEITNWSLIVASTLPEVSAAERHMTGAGGPDTRCRSFYDAALRETVEAKEVDRAALLPGMKLDGPAVIVEPETSTIVTSAYSAVGQGDGSVLLLRKGDNG